MPTATHVARDRDGPVGERHGSRPHRAALGLPSPGATPVLGDALQASAGARTQLRLQRMLDQRPAVTDQAKLAQSLSQAQSARMQPMQPIAPPATTLQRKLSIGGTVYSDAEELAKAKAPNIKNQDRPSRGVRSLLAASDVYYVPDKIDVDLARGRIRALAEKKYLLGEQHHSGVWEKRTAPWSNIAKMSEGYSRLETANDQSGQAIAAAEAKIVQPGALLPLEDTFVKAITMALLLQDALNSYDRAITMRKKQLVAKKPDQELIASSNKLVAAAVRKLAPPLLYVSEEIDNLEAFARELAPAAKNNKALDVYLDLATPLAKPLHGLRTQVSALLKSDPGGQQLLPALEKMLETESIPGLQGGIQSYIGGLLKVSDLPNPLKLQVSGLAVPGAKDSYKWAEAVDPARERIMLARITGQAAPLLVQLGDSHRQNLESGQLPGNVVPVPLCTESEADTERDPFVIMTTFPEHEERGSALPWLAGAALVAAIGVGAWLWSRSRAR